MNTEVMFSSKKMDWASTLVQTSSTINATSILRRKKMDLNNAGGGRPYFAIRHTVERLKTG